MKSHRLPAFSPFLFLPYVSGRRSDAGEPCAGLIWIMAEGQAALIYRRGEVERLSVAVADRSSALTCLSLKSPGSPVSGRPMCLVLFILGVEEWLAHVHTLQLRWHLTRSWFCSPLCHELIPTDWFDVLCVWGGFFLIRQTSHRHRSRLQLS